MISQPATVVDLLVRWATEKPQSIAFSFIDGAKSEENLTYSELLGKANGIAIALRESLKPGDRVLLVYPSGLDFITAFFGCLLAGVIAVPANPIRRNQATNRLRTIACDAGISAILTTARLSAVVREYFDARRLNVSPQWFCTDLHGAVSFLSEAVPEITSDSIALLQYTSGSTGTPKGVVVTHGNILHNQLTIAQACGHSSETIFVGWLPLFHDMGLMGNILQPLYLGIRSVLFSTNSFLGSPAIWLRAISDYRGSTSGGPNFAYDHCVNRITDEQMAGVDLSSWTVAFNGAEPIRAATLDRFAERFARFGFRKDAFHPCYGMAEATLFISGKPTSTQPVTRAFDREMLGYDCALETEGTVRLVSSGRAWGDTSIVIVNPNQLQVCGQGQIGEIWVNSPSVSPGYWQNAGATAEAFEGKIPEFPQQQFLRTGDLGFLSKGELFVTGRLKDLIILRGRNYYPQDIEAVALQASPGLGPGAVAFTKGENDDSVVIVIELDRSHRKLIEPGPERNQLIEAIQKAVFEHEDIRPQEIAFVTAGTLLRTTSGKLQRFACRRDYLEGRLPLLYRDSFNLPAVNDLRVVSDSALCRLIANVLRCRELEVRKDLSPASLGIDSMGAAELQLRLRDEFGVECRVEDILAAPTIADLLGCCGASRQESLDLPRTKDPLPLTETQQDLWFLWKAEPDSAAYNVAAALQIESGFDQASAVNAMNDLVRKHPFLAARFSETAAGELLQYPGAVMDGFIVEHDVTHLAAEELSEFIRNIGARKIDLRSGPVFRLDLFTGAPKRTILLFSGHHIVVDLWSMSILIRDFGTFYVAALSGQQTTPESDWTFANYIRHCQRLLMGETGNDSASYWRNQLKGDRLALELPSDKTIPVSRSTAGKRLHFDFPGEIEARVRKLAADQGVTLYMLLLCAYELLLRGSTGKPDVTVGTPISGRNNPQWSSGVGCFINVVPIRSSLPDHLSFLEALNVVKKDVLDAMAHQLYSKQRVLRDLGSNERSRTPWFETMFALQRPHLLTEAASAIFGVDTKQFKLGNLVVSSVPAGPRDVQFDLSLMMVDSGEKLTGCFEYRTDWFEDQTIERWRDRLFALLESITHKPDQRLAELCALAPGEREWILKQGQGPALDVPQQTLHGMFEAQTRRTPNAIALEMGNRSFSYSQVNIAADKIARILISRGLRPEQRVAVILKRSPEFLIAMLGVWKAGGIYVPMDSAQPLDRFAKSGRFAFAIVPRELESIGLTLPSETVISVGRVEDLGRFDSEGDLNVEVHPDNAAYIIYTSGSTGTPKGVVISHRNAVNFGLAQLEVVPVVEGDRLLQFAAFTFDASLSDVMMAWFRGASLCLAPDEVRVPGPALERFIRDRNITMMTVASSVLEGLEPDNCTSLRQIISTAETCRRETVRRWAPQYLLFNGYGPTEATIGATLSHCEWKEQGPRWRPPIGKPFANYEVYVLDRNLELASIGATGEIFIGGIGVARGYEGDVALTAERYLPNPFSQHPGQRMYRTGDLGRLLASGEIEYLGRIDSQIKLRGFRIAPGELESAISEVANVKECAVLDAEPLPGRKYLVAYVVANGDFKEAEVLEKLRWRLPHYMIPSAFVRIPQLPRNINGKVDRRKLPVFSLPAKQPESDRLNREERRLARVWCEVLRTEVVGRHDNFFDLGGNSLLLGVLQRRILAEFGIEIPITEFFLRPTVSSLSAYIVNAPHPIPLPSGPTESGIAPSDIAVVGMAGRFPGAADLDEFWRNLASGVESITFFDKEQLTDAGWNPDIIENHSFVPARGVLDRIEYFDADFFEFTPREAELLDPQKRILLECAQTALDNAGYSRNPENEFPLQAGVFVGTSNNTYYRENISRQRDLIELAGDLAVGIASDKSFTATLLSYKLGLSGPSITLDTACSTSLAAVHEAVKSLRLGECDLALAGGASIDIPVEGGHLYEEGGIASPDGHCRPFDARAKGTLKGAGAGIVVLRRMADALRDGDYIYALIKGSAMNNDGRRKPGYTAPSVSGQEAVIRRAYSTAGLAPESIGFIEAHGTGTLIGDPIELRALQAVFQNAAPQSIAIGSVKSNIGHLDAAAGIAGFIKAVLAVHRGEIPATLHYEQPNPHFDLLRSAFFVNTELKPFPDTGGVRRAAISAFGIGGTNVHVILESAAKPVAATQTSERPLLTVISAKTPAALSEIAGNLAGRLRLEPEPSAPAVSSTLISGRRHMEYRQSYVYRSVEELAGLLENGDTRPAKPVNEYKQVALLFPGQGTFSTGLIADAYRLDPIFRECVESCLSDSDPDIKPKIRRVLTEPAFPESSELVKQLCLFVVEYSIFKYLDAFGVRPAYLLGHSLGEYAAACAAGVFSLRDALKILTLRGSLTDDCPIGQMLAVGLEASKLNALLVSGCTISAINSPFETTVSGTPEAIESQRQHLRRLAVPCVKLETSRAFHSPLMDGILEDFRKGLQGMEIREPSTPLLSNITGDWMTASEATSADYWVRHLREPVQFAANANALLSREHVILIEAGPRRTLTDLIRRSRQYSGQRFVQMLADPQANSALQMLAGVGALWECHYPVHWSRYIDSLDGAHRVPLPAYPFQRQRYWIERPKGIYISRQSEGSSPNAGRKVADGAPQAEIRLTPAEKQIADIWFDLLGEVSLGPNNRFLDSGGNSLSALRLHERLRVLYRLSVPIATLLGNPSVAELAALLPGDEVPVTPSVTPSPRPQSSLSMEQEQIWLTHKLTSNPAVLNLPLALQIEGKLDAALIRQAFMALLERHRILCAQFSDDGFTVKQQYRPASEFRIDARNVSGAEVDLISRQDAAQPFDLARDFLLRATILQIESHKTVLLITAHHIVCDGVSLALLAEELASHYRSLLAKVPSQVAPAEPAYDDYISTGASAAAENQQEQLAYWKKILADAPVLQLRGQRPRPAKINYAAAVEVTQFTEGEAALIAKAAQSKRVSLFVFLFAAFRSALARHTDQRDVCIGTAVSTRPDQYATTPGCFVNRVTIRTEGDDGQDINRWIETVREAILEALENRLISFSQVAAAVSPGGKPGHDVLHQVAISFENTVPNKLDFGEAKAFSYTRSREAAQHDLTLWIAHRSDGIHCKFEYRTAILPRDVIRALAGDFATIVRSAIPTFNTPAPDIAEASSNNLSSNTVPLTKTESTLLEIWQEVLNSGPIGATDNFFSVGGNSFAAAWVGARVEKQFGFRMDLAFIQENPTVESMAKAIDAASGNSTALLPEMTARPAERFREFPLTDIQWAYLTGRRPELEMGNIATHGYLELETDRIHDGHFRDALQLLIARHDALRTQITDDNKQIILAKVPQYIPPVLDLRASPQRTEEELQRIREEMQNRTFDVHVWPLFEVRITVLSESRRRIHVGIEALICDGWSAWILLREFNTIYEELAKGKTPQLPELPYTFRDYVCATQAVKEGPFYAKARDYWMDRIEALPSHPSLPLAIDPSQIRKPRFRRRSTFLAATYWQALKEKAAARNITPAVLLLAIYGEVLAAWSNSDHFTLNITVFNRLPFAPEVDEIVGNFSSTSLLEVDLRERTGLTDSARRLGEQLWRDLAHVHFSGVEVLRELSRKRGGVARARMPVVFTSMIGFLPDNVSVSTGVLDPAKEMYSLGQTSQVWLDCVVAERNGGVSLIWDAVEDLFPTGLLNDMFQAFEKLAIRLAIDDESWNLQAPRLTPDHQLEHRPPLPNEHIDTAGELLQGLFQRSANLYPERIAVSQGGVEISYSQLQDLSTALANELRELGARPNQLVAILMEKGWEQVVAALGILESGAAYLPIDASLPFRRQAELLKQGNVQFVITQIHIDLPAEAPVECLRITLDRHRLARSSPPQLASVSNDRDLAYCIFTSGSTGIPKGVMIDHRGAVNTILDINRRFGVNSSDGVLALSALSFDLSVYDIFGILAAGGHIIVPTAMGQREPSHWLELMERYRVTIWNTVPALMQMLVDFAEVSRKQLPTLRLILLSGDWIPVKLPDRVRRIARAASLISLGGATEASIWSNMYAIGAVPSDWKSIPYGKALTHQSMQVLDSHFRECPDWTTGEIYIGGVGLAQGYWGDNEMTAARFVRHPFTKSRLYRTGDLGRYLPDGNIEFLGRVDTQVKIAGYRIELSEIEATLLKHPKVSEAVARVDQTGQNKRLVAFVTLNRMLPAEQSSNLLAWQDMIEAGQQQAANPANDIQAPAVEVKEAMERMRSEYITSAGGAFAALGLFTRKGETAAAEDVLLRGVAPRYERWIRRAMRCLAQEGYLRQSGSEFECIVPFTPNGSVNTSSLPLWQVLTEQEHSAQLYIREETAEGYQKIFPLGHAVVKACVERYSASLGGTPLQVLEIGAGLGSCTQHVLPALPEGSSYYFTDISQMFLRSAREKFRNFRFVNYALLNIDNDPSAQGFDPHSFDLILAASMLHDARDIRRSLGIIRSLLKPNGLLLMIEETKFYPFFDLGMGLQQGFDVFEDHDLRVEHPLLSREIWQNVLGDCGYVESAVIRHPGSISDLLGFDVIAALGPADVASFHTQEVMDFLAERLPRYMLPNRLFVLDQLPLNANGKVDRQALPATETIADPQTEYAQPTTPLENEIVAIWQDLLDRHPIGVHDNFFMIGGDSLLASQFVVKVRERLNVQFPMRAMFETPTVAEIAGLIEATRPVPRATSQDVTMVTGAI